VTGKPPDLRVGTGFDFHPFDPERPLYLGGVAIPGEAGLAGHSDADALLHAVMDALLGAAGMKDIGSYFPDTDPQYRGESSLILLEKVYRLLRGKQFLVGNLDVTVIAEVPRIQPHVEAIQANLSRVLRIPAERIAIKATSMEGKGPIGRREGLAVQAAVLLYREEEAAS
jgi:2-C-methyl-D-erythritol 2,4-cyclodiphosphate synthase